MNQLVTYEMTENILYCPLAFNNTILQESSNRSSNHCKIEERVLLDLLNTISDNDCLYIIDCVTHVGDVSFSRKNNSVLSSHKNIAFYCKESFYNILLNSAENQMIKDCHGCLVYNSDVKDVFSNFMKTELTKKDNIIRNIYSYIYIKFFLLEIKTHQHIYEKENLKYLESSNVYVNRYINIKALFSHPKYVRLTIDALMQQITDSFPDTYKRSCLIGVSNNGIILSRLLAYKMQLEARSINHIGPRYCLNSDSEFLKNLKGKKFILVSDVICLGGEYRMAKGVLNALGAKLLGAVCIVMIRSVYRNDIKKSGKDDLICSILDDINAYKIDGEEINYKVYIDKEEPNYGNGENRENSNY